MGVIPSVSYQHFQYVFPLSQLTGDIICQVHYPVASEIVFDSDVRFRQTRPPAVVREVRNEYFVADFFPVDIEFKISQPGDKGCGRSDLTVKIHSLSELRCRCAVIVFPFTLPGSSDPLRLPFLRRNYSHPPFCRPAPFRCVPMLVPDLYLPPHLLAAAKFLAFVWDEYGPVRTCLPAVPYVRFVQHFRR